MGAWYWIGVFAGLGTALGVASTGIFRRALLAFVVAGVIIVAVAFAIEHWYEAVAGAIGALCGAFGSAPIVAGALRRGGTRGATATLVGIAALLGAGLAFIPVVGYVEALAVPALGLRIRRRTPDTHAGLRTLARD